MMKNVAIAAERSSSDLDRSVCAALKAANANSIDGVERCFDILRYLKSLNLSVKDLCNSKEIILLESLRKHENPKLRMGVDVLFKSWFKTLYWSGRDPPPSTCSKDVPLSLKKPKTVFLRLKKNKDERSISQALETGESTFQTQKETSCPSLKTVRDNTCISIQSKKTEDQRYHETKEAKQNLKKADDVRKVKKQSALPVKLSKNPKSGAHEAEEIKKNLKKPDACKSVSTTSRPLPMKKQPPLKVSGNPKYCPAVKRNETEMLELFEIAKKSADVANAKGLLAAKAETSICVDTLSLLIGFPISSTAPETRRIMERLACLTKHKDRKICNSASALLQHWRQSIRDQQLKDARRTHGY
ncbi:hypothetical protein EUTSA_v10017685mg [Eutrema salsugineum]|uniref:TFIIS N-terminal domain-containing protein n=1 Tax=Eutrema salsugineum TaxID=72664 RepID=V4M6I5_EUTSA|nr:hypothetical protein EUTSA_v10017685mg [Eutrema salsugineum]